MSELTEEQEQIVIDTLKAVADSEDAEISQEAASLTCRSLLPDLDREDTNKKVADSAQILMNFLLPKVDEPTRDLILHELVVYEL